MMRREFCCLMMCTACRLFTFYLFRRRGRKEGRKEGVMCCGSIVQEQQQQRRVTGADGIRRVTGGRERAAYLIIFCRRHPFVRSGREAWGGALF